MHKYVKDDFRQDPPYMPQQPRPELGDFAAAKQISERDCTLDGLWHQLFDNADP